MTGVCIMLGFVMVTIGVQTDRIIDRLDALLRLARDEDRP